MNTRTLYSLRLKLTVPLILLVLTPLGAALWLTGQITETAANFHAAEANASLDALDKATGAYHELFETTKRLEAEITDRVAKKRELQDIGSGMDVAKVLADEARLEPSLRALAVVRDGSVIAEASRPRRGEGFRDKVVEQPLANAGAVLQLTFEVSSTLQTELQQLKRSLDGAREIAQLRAVELPSGIRYTFLAFMAAFVVAAGVVGWLMSTRVTRHVEQLVTTARRVSEGRLDARVDVSGRDEIAELGRAFNTMLDDLDTARGQLQYLQRMGVWQDVARRLAHEIKNPLTPIQLAVQQCVSQYKGDDPRYKKLLTDTGEIVEEEIAGLRRLVDTFRTLGALPKVEKAPLALAEVIEELRLDPAVASRLELSPPATPVTVRADKLLLKRVLANLVENGIHAGRGGGDGGEGRDRLARRPRDRYRGDHGRRLGQGRVGGGSGADLRAVRDDEVDGDGPGARDREEDLHRARRGARGGGGAGADGRRAVRGVAADARAGDVDRVDHHDHDHDHDRPPLRRRLVERANDLRELQRQHRHLRCYHAHLLEQPERRRGRVAPPRTIRAAHERPAPRVPLSPDHHLAVDRRRHHRLDHRRHHVARQRRTRHPRPPQQRRRAAQRVVEVEPREAAPRPLRRRHALVGVVRRRRAIGEAARDQERRGAIDEAAARRAPPARVAEQHRLERGDRPDHRARALAGHAIRCRVARQPAVGHLIADEPRLGPWQRGVDVDAARREHLVDAAEPAVAHHLAVRIEAGELRLGDRERLDRKSFERRHEAVHRPARDPRRLAELEQQQRVPPRRVPLRPVHVRREARRRGVGREVGNGIGHTRVRCHGADVDRARDTVEIMRSRAVVVCSLRSWLAGCSSILGLSAPHGVADGDGGIDGTGAPDFTIRVTNASPRVPQSGSDFLNLEITRTNLTSAIEVAIPNPPADVTVTPTIIDGTTGSMLVMGDANLTLGSDVPLHIVATAGTITHSVDVTAVVTRKPGILDPGFDNTGQIILQLQGGNAFGNEFEDVVFGPNGALTVVGDDFNDNGGGFGIMWTLTGSGSGDPAFNGGAPVSLKQSSGSAPAGFFGVTRQSDGHSIGVGFSRDPFAGSAGQFPAGWIASVRTTGVEETQFGDDESNDFFDPQPGVLAVQAQTGDALVMVAGDGLAGERRLAGDPAPERVGRRRRVVQRRQPARARRLVLQAPASLALDPTGTTAYVVGTGSAGPVVIHITSSGAFDAAFGNNGVLALGSAASSATAIAVQPDGDLVVAGAPSFIARIQPNGSFDTTFGTNGIATIPTSFSSIAGVGVQSDGRIVIGGSAIVQTATVTRLLVDGTLDPTYGNSGVVTITLGTNADTRVMRLQPDDSAVVCGSEGNSANGADASLVRITPVTPSPAEEAAGTAARRCSAAPSRRNP